MIIVGQTLVSEDIADVRFACDCDSCLGGCCVEGDAGAPLLGNEIEELRDHLGLIMPYMSAEGIEVIKSCGVFTTDSEGIKGTPLVNARECAFVTYRGEVATCAIEKAWEEKKIAFRKPISCHLYPIRTIDYTEFEAVNYHKWDICKKALQKGRANNIYLFEFLKEPLIRKYGEDWYNELVLIIDYLKKKKSKQ
jgi:hypothetical protein